MEAEKNYLYRPEFGNETDIARLIELYKALAPVTKLFSPNVQLKGDATILDIGCGPGSWGIDVAYQHPEMSVIGIDIDESAIEYAMMRARTQNVENTSFEVADATQTLPFHDASVDYINISLANSFVLKKQWPLLFAECYRILRPGGWLRSTEWLVTQSSSLAMHRLARIFNQALEKDGRRYLELAPFLKPLIAEAGFVRLSLVVHAVDFSENTPAHKPLCQDWYIGAHLALPFNVKHGVATEDELKEIIEEMQKDMALPNFYGFLCLSDVTVQKPA